MLIYYSFIFFIFGTLIASFINAFEYRLKNNLNWLTERSNCPKCKHQINFYDNIPIISFLFLKGKCRHCQQKISWQYPLVEFILGLLFVFVLNRFYVENLILENYLEIFVHCFIVSVFLFIFIYDYKYLEVSDTVVISSSALLFVYIYFLDIRSLNSILLSIFIAVGFFLIQFLVSKGKWIGGGDLRIALFMGVVFDWQKILLALWLAYIIGALVSLFLLYKNKKNMQSQIAFGTFLMLASFITLFWGDNIITYYLNLIS